MKPVVAIVTGITLIVFVVLLVALWPMVSVPAGHRGVVTMFGDVRGKALDPGLNFVNPMAHVRDMNVQLQKAVVKGDAASKDLQHVSTTLTVNFELDPAKVTELYSNVGTDYEAKLLDGTAQDAFKGVTAQYTAEELITKREVVREKIRLALTDKVAHLSSGSVIVNDVFITNFDFSKEFNDAIEAKQSASQKAQKALQDLARIETEAKQRVAQAEGEAKAIETQARAVNAQGGASYVQLQAISRWDGKLPTMMLGGSAVPFVNVGGK